MARGTSRHAFGVPVVTLFGPTHVGWTETYFEKAVHVQKPAATAAPASSRVCPLGHHRCMTELTPTRDAVSPALDLLTRFTDGHPEARRHAG